MSSNMKRRPSLFVSTPPSPRTPSVTRMPRTLGGQIIPVGWNCTNSMSISSAPAVVAERAAHAVAVLEQPQHGALHVHGHALPVHEAVLQRADHLEPRAV